jgi:hypothetical protein
VFYRVFSVYRVLLFYRGCSVFNAFLYVVFVVLCVFIVFYRVLIVFYRVYSMVLLSVF